MQYVSPSFKNKICFFFFIYILKAFFIFFSGTKRRSKKIKYFFLLYFLSQKGKNRLLCDRLPSLILFLRRIRKRTFPSELNSAFLLPNPFLRFWTVETYKWFHFGQLCSGKWFCYSGRLDCIRILTVDRRNWNLAWVYRHCRTCERKFFFFYIYIFVVMIERIWILRHAWLLDIKIFVCCGRFWLTNISRWWQRNCIRPRSKYLGTCMTVEKWWFGPRLFSMWNNFRWRKRSPRVHLRRRPRWRTEFDFSPYP